MNNEDKAMILLLAEAIAYKKSNLDVAFMQEWRDDLVPLERTEEYKELVKYLEGIKEN